MSRLSAIAVLFGLTVPMACASIYGIADLPSDQGAGADAGTDAQGHPKPDASTHQDAAHDATHDGGRDTGADTGHDATNGKDAQDATPVGDGGGHDAATEAHADAPVSIIASVTPSPVTVLTGGTAPLTVTLTSALATDVQVSLAPLPTGVSAPPITIMAGSTSGMLTLTATASATEGTASPTVTAGTNTAPVSLIVAGASGTFDTSFNESGVQNFTPPGGSTTSNAVSIAVQPDGAILVAGSSTDTTSASWELVRFNPDGSPDTAFNANVIDSTKGATLPASGSVSGVAVIAGSGLIAIAGLDTDGGLTQLGILLLNADGSRHESFGVSGLYLHGPSMGNFHVTTVGGLAVSAAGTIAVTGNTTSTGYVITLSGAANSTFNETVAFPSGVGLHGIAYDPSGNLIVGGTSPDSGGQFYLTRVTGALAASGLVDGGVLGPPLASNEFLTAAGTAAVAVDSSGNTFLVGNADIGTCLPPSPTSRPAGPRSWPTATRCQAPP